jgi:hypothetical protein
VYVCFGSVFNRKFQQGRLSFEAETPVAITGRPLSVLETVAIPVTGGNTLRSGGWGKN